MNIDKYRLKEIHEQLIMYLSTNGFSKTTIHTYDCFLRNCYYCFLSPLKVPYEDLLHKYLQLNPNCKKAKVLSMLGRIQYFDINNELPTKHNSFFIQNENILSSEFQMVIDNYIRVRRNNGIKESTIRTESVSGGTFFTHFQNRGIYTVSDINESDVLDLFLNEDGVLKLTYSYMKSVRSVLKANIGSDKFQPNSIQLIISYLPALKQIRKNIQYLTVNEIKAINLVLIGNSNLSKRDKAIGLLALKYGLRSSDIINLSLFSVDLDKEIINVYQQKTGVPYTLKLIPIVGNAIYDYVTEERPKSKETTLFLRKTPPYKALDSKSAYSISIAIMNESKVRTEGINRKGFHLFRHNLATHLLSEGVKIPIISSILGHTSPNSTEKYLSSDFVNLRKCNLDVSIFSEEKEVLYEH